MAIVIATLLSLVPVATNAGQSAAEPSILGGITAQTPVRRVTGEPALVIGSASGDDATLLHGVVAAFFMLDSTLVIGDASNERLLWFDRSGRFLRAVGRRGNGPGEFMFLRSVGRCANGEIFVHDAGNARLTLFSPSGELVGSRPLPPRVTLDPAFACGRDRQFLVLLNRLRGPVTKGEYMQVQAVVVRVSGAGTDTIATIGAHEYYIAKNVSAMAHVPLGPTTLASGSSMGGFACHTLTGRCLRFTVDGADTPAFVVPAPRRAADGADWKRAVELHLGTEPSTDYRKIAQSVLGEIEPRRLLPRFDRIVTDDHGNLWVRLLDRYQDDTASWAVLSHDGSPLAVVKVSRGIEVLSASYSHILGLRRDADGVERVELHVFPSFRLTEPRR